MLVNNFFKDKDKISMTTIGFSDFQLIKEAYKGTSFEIVTLGNSMYPLIKGGDNLKIMPLQSRVSVNDVIAFYSLKEERIIVHRVKKVIYRNNRELFITKGDNNKFTDRSVTANYFILGKVTLKSLNS